MTRKNKFNILIPDVVSPPAEIEAEIFGPEVSITTCQATHNLQISDDIWRNCHAILAWEKLLYDKKLIAKLDKCKTIVRVGVGYDNIDLAAAKDRGIVVCNVPDYGTEEVADHTFALLLSLARAIPEYSETVKNRKWERCNPRSFRLREKTIGIIGLGRIGTAVALRAKSFGLKVFFYDPYIKHGYDKSLGIKRVENLFDIARYSDIITLHTPLTEETRQIINGQFFDKVRKKAILINTARGAIIDIADLKIAMKKGIIKAAGLDVLPLEPSDDSQRLIVDWENGCEWLKGRLIVTPHVAFYSPEAYEEMREKAALEALRVLNGGKAKNCVN